MSKLSRACPSVPWCAPICDEPASGLCDGKRYACALIWPSMAFFHPATSRYLRATVEVQARYRRGRQQIKGSRSPDLPLDCASKALFRQKDLREPLLAEAEDETGQQAEGCWKWPQLGESVTCSVTRRTAQKPVPRWRTSGQDMAVCRHSAYQCVMRNEQVMAQR